MYGFDHEVGHEPATEGAAAEGHVEGDVLGRDARGLRHCAERPLRRLGRRPDLAAAVVNIRRAIHRLQRSVRQIGHLVHRLDLSVGARQCRFAVPVLTGRHARVALVLIEQPRYAGARQLGSGARVELALQRVTPAHGRPR